MLHRILLTPLLMTVIFSSAAMAKDNSSWKLNYLETAQNSSKNERGVGEVKTELKTKIEKEESEAPLRPHPMGRTMGDFGIDLRKLFRFNGFQVHNRFEIGTFDGRRDYCYRRKLS